MVDVRDLYTSCHDCHNVIDLLRDVYLVSYPHIIIFKRFRCKSCGEHFQKFLRAEWRETWYNVKSQIVKRRPPII